MLIGGCNYIRVVDLINNNYRYKIEKVKNIMYIIYLI